MEPNSKNRFLCKALVFGFIVILNQNTWALDFQSSRTLSLARGGRGGATFNDTIYVNPSLLGFQELSAVSASYQWLNHSNAAHVNQSQRPLSQEDRRVLNASVTDGKNQYVHAGLSFTRRPDLDVFNAAIGKSPLPWLSLGLAAKRYSTRSNELAAQGLAFTGYDGGASMTVILPQILSNVPAQLGLTSDNLLHKKEDEEFIGPRQLAAGVKIGLYDLISVYGDYVQNFSHVDGNFPSYSLAGELALGNEFFARGGGFGFREKGWSAGAGWLGPKIGISYGFQRKNKPIQRDYQHAVTMDLYM